MAWSNTDEKTNNANNSGGTVDLSNDVEKWQKTQV